MHRIETERNVIALYREPLSADVRQSDAALRAQLNDALAACQLLQKRCESEQDGEYLAVIHRALLRSVRVLRNQELARRLEDEDELHAVFATVDLAGWCRELTDRAAGWLAEMGLTLRFSAEEETLHTLADQELLDHMLLELLSNAAGHTPEGGRLSVSLRRSETMAILTVADEGEGLSGETLERLTGDSELPPDLTPQAGAGLGLRLARAIAETHGGWLLLDTAPGGGVRAAASIPLREGTRARLRSQVDVQGGYDRALVALSDVLPARVFTADREK